MQEREFQGFLSSGGYTHRVIKSPFLEPIMNPLKNIAKIYHRENGKCFWCGRKVKCPWTNKESNGIIFDDHGTKDHLLPKSHGGTSKVYNLVLSCYGCNNIRGNRLLNPVTGQRISPNVLWVFLKERK